MPQGEKSGKRSLCLNIGCGPNGLKNWLNYDWGILPLLSKFTWIRDVIIRFGFLSKSYSTNWPLIKLVDIRKRFPLEDGSVDFIYCSHVLEHFDYWQVIEILKECKRVLSYNSCLRIVVPDIEKMAKSYLRGISRSEKSVLVDRPGLKFCRFWWGHDKDKKPANFIQKLSRKFIRDHQWNYDKYEMEIILRRAGFKKVVFSRFQAGSFPDVKKLDIIDHKELSFYMEAF